MSEVYKLPGSSYEEVVKIIKTYSSLKKGVGASLTELSQTSGMDKTVISRNNGFLTQLKLITEGNKKLATELCYNLGRAYSLGMEEQIALAWNEAINNDEFLNRMISTIQIKGEMTKTDFINHIIFSSGNNKSNNSRAGAAAIVEILKVIQLIDEKDGKIIVGSGNIKLSNRQSQVTVEDKEKVNSTDLKTVKTDRENMTLEIGYYMQSYTCENGKSAKLIIPEDSTKDDLLAFADMLKIVLKRKFKISLND